MEKIKNVLHGHKKVDSAVENPATGSQEHPIYDQMTTGHTASPYTQPKTTSGEPYTALAQPGNTAIHGQPQHVGIDGPIGNQSATATATSLNDNSQSTHQTHAKDGGGVSIVPQKVQEKLPESVERKVPNTIHDTGDNQHATATGSTTGAGLRPDANPTGSAHHAEDMSTASIKSGVIGFGPGEHQGHAARSTHNPTESNMARDQVLGGGVSGTAGRTDGQGLQSETGLTPHAQTASNADASRATNLGQISEDRPYDNTLRQESYTADTNRSFPLAGGVASQQSHSEHASPVQHSLESTTATQSAAPTSTLHQETVSGREPGTKEREAGVRDDHSREALAGAAAAAAGVGAASAYAHKDRNTQEPELASTAPTASHVSTTEHSQPKEEEGLLAKAKNLIGLGGSKDTTTADHSREATQATASTSHGAHPEALAAAQAAYGADTASSTRPEAQRNESVHRHIPGEFIATPHEHSGNTYLDYHTVVEPPPGTQHNIPHASATDASIPAQTGLASTTAPGATATGIDSSTSQPHELRHTGTLDEPLSRSSDEHHLGRDAAIGAGAVGLGAAAASRHHNTTDVDNDKSLLGESSPYSSKTIDPRVMGSSAPLEQQRFDPQARTEISPHHAAQTSNVAGITPAPSSDVSAAPGNQHHYGRDAALVGAGAGAATAGGLAAHKHDNVESAPLAAPASSSASAPLASNTSAPLTSSTAAAPLGSSNTTAPVAPANTAIPNAGSAGNDQFYGTSGAPAPIVGKNIQSAQPSTTLGSSTAPGATNVPESESHHGRNAALGGAGLAAAGAGVYAATRDRESDPANTSSTVAPGSNQHGGSTTGDPASHTIGPHKSNVANVLDPRVKPDPSKQTGHSTAGPHQSDTLNKVDPKVNEKAGQQDHHYGRDAALVGGAGAGGYGAYEAAKAYTDHRMTQPGASMNEQRYDPSTRADGPNPIASKSQYDYNDPAVQSNVNRGVDSDSHKNAALATGAGLGATGAAAGAYAGSRHGNDLQNLPIHEKQAVSSSAPTAVASSAYPSQPMAQTAQPVSQDMTKEDESHTSRNAALLGGAGAGAYAYSQQDEREKARLAERERELAQKEAKTHDKEEKKLQKDHEKQEKKLQKEHEKEEKKAQKEAEKEAEGEKKKGGILGFLHRDKSKKEKNTSSPESSPRQSRDSPRRSKEYATGTTAAAYGDDHPDSPRYKAHNLLHKDPPKGHPAREALEHQNDAGLAGKREHVGVDGPIGNPDLISGDRETRHGVYGAHPASDLEKDNTVIEPRTGLPMNVGRYGEGAGGTDGNTAIHGLESPPNTVTGQPGVTGDVSQTGTNWEAIRKANTPY